MFDATIKNKNGVGIRFETYLTTKQKRDALVKFAKNARCNSGIYCEDGRRFGHIVRTHEKPIQLYTQSTDGLTDMYLVTVGWDDTLFYRTDGPHDMFKDLAVDKYRS